MSEITTAELVKALRCCTSPEACARCAYHECEEECENEVRRDAADRLEQQEQRIAGIERELEWKDKVIELAQRKQDEAERELAAAVEMQGTWKKGLAQNQKFKFCPWCGVKMEDKP